MVHPNDYWLTSGTPVLTFVLTLIVFIVIRSLISINNLSVTSLIRKDLQAPPLTNEEKERVRNQRLKNLQQWEKKKKDSNTDNNAQNVDVDKGVKMTENSKIEYVEKSPSEEHLECTKKKLRKKSQAVEEKETVQNQRSKYLQKQGKKKKIIICKDDNNSNNMIVGNDDHAQKILTSEIGNTESLMSNNQRNSAKKKKEKSQPVGQILAEVLTFITKRSVSVITVKDDDHDESRNREVYKPRQPNASSYQKKKVAICISSSSNKIETPEQTTEPSSEQKLSGNLIITFLCSHNQTKEHQLSNYLALRPTDITEAASWHKIICDVKRDGYSIHLTPEHPEFRAFKKFLTQFLKKMLQYVMIRWMNEDKDEEESDSDEEEDDLFTEYYAMEAQASNKISNQSHEGIDSLLSLTEQISPNINLRFLDALLSIQQDKPSITSSSKSMLPKRLLKRSFQRFDDTLNLSFDATKQALCVSTILNHSTICGRVFLEHIRDEVMRFSDGSISGHDIEKKSLLRPLFQAGALSVPKPGNEVVSAMNTTITKSKFQQELENLKGFPICVFRSDLQSYKTMKNFKNQCYEQLKIRRNPSEVALNVAFRKGNEKILLWLKHIIRANDAMGSLSKSELLAVEGCTSVCTSRSFLLGLVIAILGISCDKIQENFQKIDEKLFANQYLLNLDAKDELMLIRTSSSHHSSNNNNKQSGISYDINKNERFTDTTELFFLTATLLRVSFYPAMRMKDELIRDGNNQRIFSMIQQLANEDGGKTEIAQNIPPHLMPKIKHLVASYVGWDVFFQDPIVLERMTKFTVIQLQWLVTVIRNKNELIASKVPEWMCKQPALWLSHVAWASPNNINPHQATISVKCATELLQLGTNTSNGKAFSPVVVDSLVKIISSFVKAGVSKSKWKQRRRRTDYENDDDDNMDVYLSFDQNDLGVTVFTNEQVCDDLCPILIKTFGTFDVVEGLDVDTEHGFDKYNARFKVAELLLILWAHPNGRCRQSILKLSDAVLTDFAKKVALAIGTMFDFGCDRLAEASATRRQPFISLKDKAKLKWIEKSISGNFRLARLWTRLLLQFSREPRVCKALGGLSAPENLASLIIHFIDVLTEEDGGLKKSLDTVKKRSEQMIDIARQDNNNSRERRKDALELLKSRWYLREVYGLDVSKFCHQFLALLTSWHKETNSPGETSPIMKAFATNQDFEISRYRNIFRRLIAARPQISTLDNPGDVDLIFSHDGHIDSANWDYQFRSDLSKDPEIKNQLRLSRSNRIKIEDIILIASNENILAFLDAAELIKKEQEDDFKQKVLSVEKTDEAVDRILNSGEIATDDSYGQNLKDWLVSSDPFANKYDVNSFAHYYNLTARNRSITISGKRLIREARRCYKELPIPHPNSAAFVSFAEERMDLCRACITGPIESPYAHGIFIFDVFFPSNYPNIPPLMTFMTTGGGQFRFNPNLYSDGKVCLSLLGTFNSSDESQKWNPEYSSLAQVLLSIQTQLLVEEPYFNEPGTEALRGTTTGDERSARQNLKIRLATLRFAIIDHIKHPPVGFEDVMRLHFALCRRRILMQAKRWMLESKSTDMYHRFKKAYQELVMLFSSMNVADIPALPTIDY